MTSIIILNVFVLDKTYHLVLRDSALVYPENARSVHPRVHFFKIYFFVNFFVSFYLPFCFIYSSVLKSDLFKKESFDWNETMSKYIQINSLSTVQVQLPVWRLTALRESDSFTDAFLWKLLGFWFLPTFWTYHLFFQQ